MRQFPKRETWSLITFPLVAMSVALAAEDVGVVIYSPKGLDFSYSNNNNDIDQYVVEPFFPSIGSYFIAGLMRPVDVAASERLYLFKQVARIEHAHFRAIGSLYDQTIKNILISKEAYTAFNTLNEWTLWFDFSGGCTRYKENSFTGFHSRSLLFKAGASCTYDNFFTLGLGFGVSGSRIKWGYEGFNSSNSSRVTSLFGGPYVGFEFGRGGFLATQVLLQGSNYSIKRHQPEFGNRTIEIDSARYALDIGARVEGGVDISLSHQIAAYCKPLFSLEYTSVLEPSYTEKNPAAGLDLISNPAHTGFFDISVSTEFRMEFIRPEGWMIAPSMAVGVARSVPLNSQTYYRATNAGQNIEELQNNKCDAQCLVRGGVHALFKRGVGINVQYEARLLGNTPSQLGRIGVDIEW